MLEGFPLCVLEVGGQSAGATLNGNLAVAPLDFELQRCENTQLRVYSCPPGKGHQALLLSPGPEPALGDGLTHVPRLMTGSGATEHKPQCVFASSAFFVALCS